MTEYNEITIIVIKPELQSNAEAAAIYADPEGGAGTFVPGNPLRVVGDNSNTVVAYWCRWNMKKGQRAAFAQNLGGPINIINVGGNVNLSRDRWMFNGNEGSWTPQEALAALNLDTLYYEDV